MQKTRSLNPPLHTFYRVAAFLAIFLIFHYAYDWSGWQWTTFFAATAETMFQHMKIGFYAFLSLSGLEILFFRHKIKNLSSFIDARLLGSMLLPWGMFLLWYIAAAIYGPLPNIAVEIIYANVVTIALVIMTLTLSDQWQQIHFSASARFWIIFLTLNAVLLFTVFTYNIPWAPFF